MEGVSPSHFPQSKVVIRKIMDNFEKVGLRKNISNDNITTVQLAQVV